MLTSRLPSFFATAMLALPIALGSAIVSAQCPNGAIACVDINISASANVGGRRAQAVPAPPPPPRGDVLIVQPTPPPPPPGHVVVVAPPPPPPQRQVVVRRPPPPPGQVVIIEQDAPQIRLVRRAPKLGLTARLGGILSENVRMGGVSAGVRFRPSRVFGIELSVGAYGGTDFYQRDRVEIPLAFDFMFHFPRSTRFQAYLVAGSHFSWATADGFDPSVGFDRTRDFTYFGGQAGIGGELRIFRRFAISADIRGFIRVRIDDALDPEFVNLSTGQTTDTSAGGIFNLGGHLYF